MDAPSATLEAGALRLTPLGAADADAMFVLLADPLIYRYLDYPAPLSLEQLRLQYARMAAGASPDGREIWRNWIVRDAAGAPLGYVQATVFAPASAWIAYVFASRHWGRGHAFGAMRAMLAHLRDAHGVERVLASVEVGNLRSIRLLERLGLRCVNAAEAAGHAFTPTERLYRGSLADPD